MSVAPSIRSYSKEESHDHWLSYIQETRLLLGWDVVEPKLQARQGERSQGVEIAAAERRRLRLAVAK